MTFTSTSTGVPAPTSWSWSITPGNISGTGATFKVDLSRGTTYNVTLTTNNGVCQASATAQVMP